MQLTVIDELGSLVAEVETESEFHESPDGSAFAHVFGHFRTGPGFARVRSMLDRFLEIYAAGDFEGSLKAHVEIDHLGMTAVDSQGRTYSVYNVYFQDGGPLFAASRKASPRL
jgi:hypothetical protein